MNAHRRLVPERYVSSVLDEDRIPERTQAVKHSLQSSPKQLHKVADKWLDDEGMNCLSRVIITKVETMPKKDITRHFPTRADTDHIKSSPVKQEHNSHHEDNHHAKAEKHEPNNHTGHHVSKVDHHALADHGSHGHHHEENHHTPNTHDNHGSHHNEHGDHSHGNHLDSHSSHTDPHSSHDSHGHHDHHDSHGHENENHHGHGHGEGESEGSRFGHHGAIIFGIVGRILGEALGYGLKTIGMLLLFGPTRTAIITMILVLILNASIGSELPVWISAGVLLVVHLIFTAMNRFAHGGGESEGGGHAHGHGGHGGSESHGGGEGHGHH